MSTATDTLYHNLFVTGLCGGIGYWSACSGYDDDADGYYADIIELGDDYDETTGPVHVVDRAVIARGYRLAISPEWRNRLAWSSAKPPVVVTDETADDWDADAGDADMVIQLGLFGDVRYG